MVHFNPKNCINCLACMTIEDCRLLISAIRHGGPRFGEEKCVGCTKCADICGRALTITERNCETCHACEPGDSYCFRDYMDG